LIDYNLLQIFNFHPNLVNGAQQLKIGNSETTIDGVLDPIPAKDKQEDNGVGIYAHIE